ncbi:MAG: CRISPR-associated endoribonuclease Cas6 [Candidatus Aminicenantaceae bacterium]
MNSFIYDLLSESFFPEVSGLHESNDPKLFSFSGIKGVFGARGNIIPTKEKQYVIEFSSPNQPIFFSFISGIKKFLDRKNMINLGEAQFSLKDAKTRKVDISAGDILANDAIIALKNKDGKYLFVEDSDWKKTLERNCGRKLQLSGIRNPKTSEIIKALKITEQGRYAIPNRIGGKNIVVRGSSVKIEIGKMDEEALEQMGILFDCGIGSNTSYGFGFLRKVRSLAP